MFFYNAWGFLFVFQMFFGPIIALVIPNTVKILGLIVYTCGVILAIWAKRSLGRSWGLPEQHYKSSQKSLIVEGAYRYSRNPIYLSELIMLLGFEIALGSLLVILVVPFYLFNKKKIILEEKLLENNFGERYLKYKKSVKRFI